MIGRIKNWLFRRRYKRWSKGIRGPALDMRSVSGVTSFMRGTAGLSPSTVEQQQRLQQMLMGQAQNHNPYQCGLQSPVQGLLGGALSGSLGLADWQWRVR